MINSGYNRTISLATNDRNMVCGSENAVGPPTLPVV